MLKRAFLVTAIVTAMTALMAASAQAAEKGGLKQGTPDLQAAGPLAFAPEGILLVADPQQAAVFAIDTGDASGDPSRVKLQIENIDEKVAALLGTTARDVLINDMAVNPASGKVYLSVSRGRGPEATPVILRIDGSGKLSEVPLKDVRHAKATLPNAPADKVVGEGRRRSNPRRESITDLAYVDGRVIVAGLSNEEFASKLRSIPFPFEEANEGTSVEIFHGAHGRFETRSPVRTFVPYDIAGKPHVLAAYTCTPLVKFPLSQLKPGEKIKGTTIAELGNRNRPLDMIVYKKGGKQYLLLANSSRGVMKITTDGIDKSEGITERVGGGGTAGLSYDTIDQLKGVQHLDKLNDQNALLLVRNDEGALNLQTVPLP